MLYAIDTNTGEQLAQQDIGDGGGDVWALGNNVVYVTGGDQPPQGDAIVAVGTTYTSSGVSLSEKWRVQTGECFGGSTKAAVANGIVYITEDCGRTWALNADNGDLRWRVDDGSGDGSGTPPTIAGGTVYFGPNIVGDSANAVHALDGTTGTERDGWPFTFSPPGSVTSSPAVADGTVFFGSDNGYVYAVNAADGTLAWDEPFSADGAVTSAPVVASGTLYVGSNAGTVYLLDTGTGAEIDRFETGDAVSSAPAIASGNVYIGSHDGNLYGLAEGDDNGVPTETSDWTQQTKLTATDGDSNDRFGRSVSVSADGTTAIVGANFDEDPNGQLAGSVYVFEQVNDSWQEATKLTASGVDTRDWFGESVAVAADGTTVIVGAPQDEGPEGKDPGSAYVFEQSDGSWQEQARLTASDGDADDFFGGSIAISADGTTAVVGDQLNLNHDEPGAAYVFRRVNDAWTQQAELAGSNGDTVDRFGESVSMSANGETAVLGAPDDTTPNGAQSGAVYVFTRRNGVWTQQARLIPSDAGANDSFGWSVTISGDGMTAILGALWHNTANTSAGGAAYVFERSSDDWREQTKLTASDSDSGDNFGGSVAVAADGKTAIVGSRFDQNPNGERAGSAYVFEASTGSWQEQAKLVPSDGDAGDFFGWSGAIAADGTSTVLGAPIDEDPNGERGGSAYVFTKNSQSESNVTAAFAITPDSASVDDPITFDATPSAPADDINAYRWSFPNTDNPSSGQVIEHTFGAPGEYPVTLQVEADGETASVTQTVTVTQPRQGTVSGKVVGSDGTPVTGASVTIIEPIHEYLALLLVQGELSDPVPAAAETTTDTAGRFRIDDVPIGEYLLIVEPTDSFGGALHEDVIIRPGEATDLTVEVQAGRYLAELDGELLRLRNAATNAIDESTEATAETYLSGYETFERSEMDTTDVLLYVLQTVNFALSLTDPNAATTVRQEVVSYLGNTVGLPVANHGFDHLIAERWQTVHGTRFQSALHDHTETCLAMDRITAFEPTGSLSEAQSAFEETEPYGDGIDNVESAWTRYDEQIATTEPPNDFDLPGVKAVLRKQTNWLEGEIGGLASGISITPTGDDVLLTDVAEYHADLYDGIERAYDTARSLELVTEGLQAAGKGLAISGVASGGTTAAVGSVAYAGGAILSFELSMYQTYAKNRLAHTWTNTLTYWVSDLTAVAALSNGVVAWLAGQVENPTDLRGIDGTIQNADLGLLSVYDRTVLIANQPEYPPWWILPDPKWKAVGTATVTIRNTGDVETSARAVAIDTYQMYETESVGAVSDAASFQPTREEQPLTLAPGEERTVEFEFGADFDPFNPLRWHQMEIGLWMDGRVPDRNTQFYYVLPDPGLLPVPSSTARGVAGLADRRLATDRFTVTHGGKRTDEGLTVAEWAQRVGPIKQLVETQVTPDDPRIVTGYTPTEEAAGVTFVMGAPRGSDVALHVYDDQNRRVGPEPGADDVVEIPTATYNGSDGATQIVEIQDTNTDRYRLRVDGTRMTAGQPVPVTLHAIEIPEREALLVVSPTVARQTLSDSEAGTVRIGVGEGGNQAPIQGIDVTLGGITTAGGNMIPDDGIEVSPATFDLSAGERRTVRVTVDAAATTVPETGETRYDGTMTVDTENAGRATVELSVLLLDAGDTNVDLADAAASVRGVHVSQVEPEQQPEPPEGFAVESAYDIRSVGEGAFTLAFPDEQFGEEPAAYVSPEGEWTPISVTRYPETIRVELTAGVGQTLVVGQEADADRTEEEGDEPSDGTTVPDRETVISTAAQAEGDESLPDWVPLVGGGVGVAGIGAGVYHYLRNNEEADNDE